MASIAATTGVPPYRFHVLDGMRGIAAILVMAFHYYSSFSFSFFSNTYVAVDFFFILSGFVVYHSYGQKLLDGMSATDYITRRIARLFPMMAVAIIIGIVPFYLLTMSSASDFSRRDIVASAVMNMFFIPYLNYKKDFAGQLGHIFPIDPALWSIFFELSASVFFLWLLRLSNEHLGKLVICCYGLICASCVMGSFVSFQINLDCPGGPRIHDFLGGFPRVLYGFACGMILYRWRATPAFFSRLNKAQKIRLLNPVGLYLCLATVLLFPFWLHGFYYLIAIATFAPFLVMQGSKAKCRNTTMLFLSEQLGRLSYPIYCLHLPVINAVRVLNSHVQLANRLAVPTEALAMIATLLLAICLSLILDKFFQKWFSGLLQKAIAAIVNNKIPRSGALKN